MIITPRNSIRIKAYSALELSMNAPYWVEDKAALCTPTLIHFDPAYGTLQFNTNCSGSRNTWIQTITFIDWWSVVTLEDPNQIETLPDMETSDNTELDHTSEHNDKLVTQHSTWEEVRGMYPDVINLDVQVHCNCPAFRWWGAWYNLEQNNSAIYPENIQAPNPELGNQYELRVANNICKHLAAVFRMYF